jgi:hypothetical protein
MAKKCIPGIICVENMTLFVLILLCISVGYLYFTTIHKNVPRGGPTNNTIILAPSRTDDSIYTPPLNTIDIRGPPAPDTARGIPINIRTSTANTSYRQMGILTKNIRDGKGGEPIILPLFGRNLLNGRDKWQYYTMANSGFNAKLPISVNGKSCTGEYGCDSIYNGDTVFVEGYDETFRATIYENGAISYIPI